MAETTKTTTLTPFQELTNFHLHTDKCKVCQEAQRGGKFNTKLCKEGSEIYRRISAAFQIGINKTSVK